MSDLPYENESNPFCTRIQGLNQIPTFCAIYLSLNRLEVLVLFKKKISKKLIFIVKHVKNSR